jgi:hypothetical protein
MADVRVTIRLDSGETEQYEIDYLPTLEAAYAADARKTAARKNAESRRANSPLPAPMPAQRRRRIRRDPEFGLSLDTPGFAGEAHGAPIR